MYKKIVFVSFFLALIALPAFAQITPEGQQQSTFNFDSGLPTVPPVVTNTPIPGSPLQPTPVDLLNQEQCRPPVSDLNPIYSIGGLQFGWAAYTIWSGELRHAKGGYWYYIPQTVIEDDALLANLDSILKTLQGQTPDVSPLEAATPTAIPTFQQQQTNGVGQQQSTFDVTPEVTALPTTPVTLGELKIRKQEKIIRDIALIQESCPLRLTGASPTLFLYGPENTDYKVTPEVTLTYMDPVAEENSWLVHISDQGNTEVNNVERPYIYYEYEPVVFEKPQEGWVLNKSMLKQFAQKTLKDGLKLNDAETERGLFELQHAASTIKGTSVFIGLIAQSEVNQKVPITISPDPQAVYRLHFYVGSANSGENPRTPLLYPLQRTETMALEIGSFAGN